MEADKSLERASSTYSKNAKLRATVQLIPYVGSSLDTLISSKGLEIQQKRIEEFIHITTDRLSKLEGKFEAEEDEDLFDLFTSMIDGVVKTKSVEKQAYFASILCNQLSSKDNWEEAEIATRILKDLDVVHIRILNYSLMLPTVESPFDREQVFSLTTRFGDKENLSSIPYLGSEFPEYTPVAFRMVCSELVAKSLLHDVGLGGIAIGSMDFCSPTETASWFIEWLRA